MQAEPNLPRKPPKQLWRVGVICSNPKCGYQGNMPWVGNENRCPECGRVEMRR